MAEWSAWIVYQHDMGIHVDAIFAEEIDALRFAVGNGFSQRVAKIGPGDIGDQIRAQESR